MLCLKFLATVLAASSMIAAIPRPHGSSECTTGSQLCCNSVMTSNTASNSTDASSGLVSVLLTALNVPVGITCTPISVVGILAGSAGCTANPVCCDSTQGGGDGGSGLIGINCLPISISL